MGQSPLRSSSLSGGSKQPPGPLQRMDARMVSGLPEPESREAMDWLHDALAALQRQDDRPDVDLASIEDRLRALEARPLPGEPVDLTDLWDAFGALSRRLNALEERVAAQEAASASVQQVLAPADPPIVLDPLDPLAWIDLASAKAALMVLVTQAAARLCGHAIELYEEMVLLDARGDSRTKDEEIRLLQHASWAKERNLVELARLTHNSHIARLESVDKARQYDWTKGWPELG